MRTHQFLKYFGLLIIGGCILAATGAQVIAQSTEDIWTPAVNVSQSGAASNPVIATAPDSTLHVLWWDDLDGEQYARTNLTSTAWTQPVNVPQIVGRRQVDLQTNRVILAEPRNVVLAADAGNRVHAFWFNTTDQLLHAQISGTTWSDATVLAEAATILNTATDESGALHLAYAQSADSPESPAGLYYRVNSAGRWSPPSLIHASSYFRAAQPEALHLSVASDAQGQLLVAWADPSQGQSLYARSDNGGATWSAPQPIASTQGATAKRDYVVATPSGEFLMLWQELGTGGCGYVQSRSVDGGLTWGAPEKVLSGLTRCDENLSFTPDSTGALWLAGQLDGGAETGGNHVSLAKWDGNRWSDPLDVSHTFSDPATGRTIALNCLRVAIGGQTAGLSGCDSVNDVWAARNAVALDQLIVLGRSIWSPVVALSDGSVSVTDHDTPALIADSKGNYQALWSQDLIGGNGATGLYGATWEGSRWSRPAAVVRTTDNSPSDVPRAVKPALAIDNRDQVHAVWSTGTNGIIQYSSTHARDFVLPRAWAPPLSLPTPDGLMNWPDIAADPRGGTVYVAYAVPFNEKRGIYLVRSQDSGTTWITPTLIFDAAAAGWSNVDKPRLALDAAGGILHVAWLRPIPEGGVGPQEIYYARSTDQGHTWSPAMKIAEGDIDWPRLVVPDTQQVYMAWTEVANTGEANLATPFKVRGQFSPDGGQRWSPASDIPGFEQVSGPIGLAVGGAGQMYLVAISQGIAQEAVLLNAQWNGQIWDKRESLLLGQPATAGNAAIATVNPVKNQLMVILGMHALDQLQADRIGLSSTVREVEAAQLIPIPTFTPAPIAMATPGPTLTPQPTPRPTLSTNRGQPFATDSGPNPLVLGGALGAVIVVVVFVIAVWRRRK
jgi:hypothetical protein